MKLQSQTKSAVLPFGMLSRESESVDRGDEIYPATWNYDPQTQLTDLIKMGRSNVRTKSQIQTGRGPFSSTDNSVDDTGED